MSKAFERYQKRKLISSYFSVVLSISLVLFMLGALGLLVLNTRKLADHFKEQVTISVFLKDTAKEAEVEQLQKSLAMANWTRSSEYVSKDKAAAEYSEEIGEDFLEFLGENPLRNSVDITLKAEYVSPVQIDSIATSLGERSYIEEVSYDQPLITLLTENVKRLSLWILVTSGVFTFIAVLLINSSIRLSIYSKRFIIKTMQMVGATKGFIRRPFLWTNVKLGLLGSLLAILMLGGILYYLETQFPELGLLEDLATLAILFGGIIVLGILISLLSTFFATQRFLNLRTDDLYY